MQADPKDSRQQHVAHPSLIKQNISSPCCIRSTVLPGCLQGNVAPAMQAQTAPSLGTRRRLVVLRCPRLGSAQQAGLDDAVAASLSLLPACAAAINLQSLTALGSTTASEQNEGGLLPPIQAASSLQPAPVAVCKLPQPAGAVPGEVAGGGTSQLPGSDQHTQQPDAGGLSAYLSSWFGSPSKPAQPVLPSPEVGLASAMESGSTTPRTHRLAVAGGGSSLEATSPRWQAAPSTAASAAQAAASARHTADEAAASSSGVSDLLADLEGRLAPLLPSVGVVHLGCPQAAGNFVLRWRQRLQVVAEPSKW